jgi:Tol biopolymer transport system component
MYLTPHVMQLSGNFKAGVQQSTMLWVMVKGEEEPIMKRLLLILIMLLLGGSVFPFPQPAQAQDPDAPFLFYYDLDLNSFVLDRADGQDYRLFLSDVLPEDMNVGSYVWSHDYSLLALGLEKDDEMTQLWVVNYAGEIISRIEGVTGSIIWSPINRYILLQQTDEVYERYIMYLIDLSTSQIVNTYDSQAVSASITIYHEYPWSIIWQDKWSPDGEMVGFDQTIFDSSDGSSADYFAIMTADGEFIRRETTRTSFMPDGRLLYLSTDKDRFYIEDLTTESIEETGMPPGRFWSVNWHPDGEVALITMQTNCVDSRCTCPCSFWTLDINTLELSLLLEQAYLLHESRHESGGLPISTNGWLPYSHSGDYGYIDLNTMEVVPLDVLQPYTDWAWVWYSSDLLMTESGDQWQFFTFDVAEREIHGFIDYPFNHTVSPDGRYIIGLNPYPVIYDSATDSLVQFPPHSQRYPPAYLDMRTSWHPDGKWVILGENTCREGGGRCGVSLAAIVTVDGMFYRELSNYPGRWLPVEIDPDVLTTISYEPELIQLPEPVEVLQNDERSRVIYWHPDGSQLVSMVRSGSDDHFQVWDIASAERINVLEADSGTVDLIWQIQDDGGVTPQLQETEVEADFFLTSPNGSQYLTPHGDQLMMVVTENNEEITSLDIDWRFTSFSYHPDGSLLLAASTMEGLQFYDTQTGTALIGIPIYADAAAFSPDGEFLAVSTSWEIRIYRVSDLMAAAQ